MIENVNRDDIEICDILFSSDRNGGGPISDKKFLQNNILILFFTNSNTAKICSIKIVVLSTQEIFMNQKKYQLNEKRC